jgi:2-oxoglutarate ferredoxin oxidoreductase subunit beta
MESQAKDEVLTGVFYVNPEAPTFIDHLNLVDVPLGTQPESVTKPGKDVLDKINASLQ